MQKLFGKYQSDLAQKTLKVVNAYAKEKGISIVLDKSSGASRGGVLFGADALDITDEISSRINK